MNCPSRTDEPVVSDGHNQNPNPLSNDLTTNEDLNGLANSRVLRRSDSPPIESAGAGVTAGSGDMAKVADAEAVATIAAPSDGRRRRGGGSSSRPGGAATTIAFSPPGEKGGGASGSGRTAAEAAVVTAVVESAPAAADGASTPEPGGHAHRNFFGRVRHALVTFGKFVGPGFMIAVAYIDPGNYSTDIAAGASYRFRLLFVVLLSNLFAIFLQSLSIKLGTVSGLNLAEACRAFLPRWLNYLLYGLAEIAIIATDIAEVIGTAIALNLLIPQIPLVGGCAISIVDVMIILLFYSPGGSMRGLRAFEFFVALLVVAVVVCFCVQLSLIRNTAVADVFQGYLPSSALVEQQGLYQACGILGATVMPHSLYLGSGVVQSRLRDYDAKRGLLPPRPYSASSEAVGGSGLGDGEGEMKTSYVPSLAAIRHSMKYSISELAISLFTFALFVNSAILIVAGAALHGNPDALDADIFGIHDLLASSLAPAAGTVFALALLLSGVSAGIVCTIAGQMVSEGALDWRMQPWLRRLVTRSISITPSIIIAGAVGRTGLDAALNGSQVALSVVLPFVSAPLIWFTCFDRYMTVRPGGARFLQLRRAGGGGFSNPAAAADDDEEAGVPAVSMVKMANSWPVTVLGVFIWLVIAAMNVANLVLLGVGK